MTRDRCKRTWEIEALVDGRLADRDRSSLERHASSCVACSSAKERLRRLSEVLAELPAPEPTPLEVRRQRAALLSRANERVVTKAPRAIGALVGVGLAAMVVVIAVVLVRGRSAPEPAARVAPPAPQFETTDVGHAEFSSERVESTSRVTLRTGTLALHVEHVEPGARFVVTVPDGEVEVRGTRFTVDVADGRTQAVHVTEGVVEVRLTGFRGVLRAGESWPPREAALPPSVVAPPADAGVPASPPASSSAVEAAPPPAPPAPGARFAVAMRAYSAGDYGEAERLLAAFVREYPDDSRSEDAMFLIADARTRRGDTAGARAAAADYLRRYPSGLRAPAARRLAGEAIPGAEP